MSVGIWRSLALQSFPDSTQKFLRDFKDQARESLRQLAERLMEQEIFELAGWRYQRVKSDAGRIFRAGSDPGTVRIGGQRVLVRKPRLKQHGKDRPLASYQALRHGDLLTARVIDCMIRGLSTRDYGELLDEIAGGLGLSKSSVSRAFVNGSRQALEMLQSRDLSNEVWGAVQIDAIHFAKRSLIVALGINGMGKKIVLGMQEGSTESAAVCVDLLQNLIARGLRTNQPFVFVLDGGRGLRKAVTQVFGEDWPVQRCLIHKARNIEAYLPERAWIEARRRWARVRRCERHSDAKAELWELRRWLGTISSEAVASLDEAGEELLTAHRWSAGRVLRRSLTTTNLIESTFSQVRRITGRVKYWSRANSPHPDQIKRWTALALLHTERSSSYIKGYNELSSFLVSLHERGLKSTAASA